MLTNGPMHGKLLYPHAVLLHSAPAQCRCTVACTCATRSVASLLPVVVIGPVDGSQAVPLSHVAVMANSFAQFLVNWRSRHPSLDRHAPASPH